MYYFLYLIGISCKTLRILINWGQYNPRNLKKSKIAQVRYKTSSLQKIITLIITRYKIYNKELMKTLRRRLNIKIFIEILKFIVMQQHLVKIFYPEVFNKIEIKIFSPKFYQQVKVFSDFFLTNSGWDVSLKTNIHILSLH